MSNIVHRLLTYSVMAMALCIAAAVPAHAETISIKAGKATAIGPFYTWETETCYLYPPATYGIAKQPEHGTLKIVVRKGVRDLGEGRCPGASGKMLYFVYQPKRGYKGEDRFRVTWAYETYVSDVIAPKTETFRVIVE